ncbi:MAG TPA: helix-turn-helix domain-containing protein [Lysobacter sp.]|jgi:transcriptional regulator GlxA family with amidase domain|nr:helix-turn-helix domain-containing protein [Lysobacter sp.]
MYDFTIVVLRDALATSVAVITDILSAAAQLATRTGAAAPRWRVVSPGGGAVALSNGLSIKTAPLPRRARNDSSTWIVPGLSLDGSAAAERRLLEPDAIQLVQALRASTAAGRTIAAGCTAVFLLQAAGLLAGRKATTSWWLAPQLQQLEPACAVDANRMVIADGPIVTAGAAFAQTDLTLYLLRDRFGVALADAVSRVLLIDGRQAQTPYVTPMMFVGGNDLVAKIQARIEAALPSPPTVAEIASEFCMSERTLARRIRATTGRSPLMLVQSVRVAKARSLLESSRYSVEQVAERVGYSDATALRRLIRKTMGATPRQLRPQCAA